MSKPEPLTFSGEIFDQMPVMGILRNVAFDDVMEILPLYAKAGLTTIEITMNSPDAVLIIQSALQQYGHILNIGAGTVCSISDLENALSAGAQFIVAPNIDKQIIKKCKARHIPIFPGAFTPTEIKKVWDLGAYMVKVFPANALGVGYLKDILAPLGHIKIMATGGVSLKEIQQYLSVGVKGLGIGTPLFPQHYILNRDWQGLKGHFDKFVEEIKEYRSKDMS
ncbi:bifunctional 4-hydroxy-2-oxoglutarate aldolase/2-dehydro-3-deoxy-phosphogluconate aldolase [Aquiflexum sp.]|uniref:bifunctional 4-hydroxy-2-oxoglutarate aldolase/2-dehydro-3-deoxy-phosphogluconate aldolase n=1 Tax=Aquiflexum sp. TaxID=1872584 RepID=UPI0035932B5B